ncbi:class I SAM-dependent methyltransferase [Isosphaeraceae bacterium EP7]
MPKPATRSAASSLLCLFLSFGLTGDAFGQAPPAVDEVAPAPARKAPAKKGARRARAADGPKMYMGRAIAPVMTFQGAEWLVRPEREQEEQPEKMLDALKLKAGDVVADVGAGVGYTSLRIARRVGPKGLVLATDIQPEMIQMLKANAAEFGATNVRPVLCTPTESKLPKGKVDLILMVDVYHECDDPEAVLQDLKQALKPGGRLVLVEFRGEDPEVPIKPEHKMTVAQVRKELEPQGYKLIETHEFLPWQHILIFETAKDAAAEAKSRPKDGATQAPETPKDEPKASEPPK